MAAQTIYRYFGTRFLSATLITFFGIIVLVALIQYVELMRRAGDVGDFGPRIAQMSFYRVPQTAERILPFVVLFAAMGSFLNLSRRLELVVVRSAGLSAWQFTMPALVVALVLGVIATTLYNPVAAYLQEQSKRIEIEVWGGTPQTGLQMTGGGLWVRQRSADGYAIINSVTAADQGVRLGGIIAFTFDSIGRFQERIEARTAVLEKGHWRLSDVRTYASNKAPQQRQEFLLPTTLTTEQVRETLSTAETVPFWDLPLYIEAAELAGLNSSAYRVQYQKLLARPFLLGSMVLLAAAVSLRSFRFGGIQQRVLIGVMCGFLLYVLSKLTEDLSKAGLIYPTAAAWLPVFVGAMIGIVGLLYQEDG
jgi:lipopolysaccharide export system permease protein